MVKNNEIDMINGKTLKKMIFFSIPIIFTSIFQLLFNTIDIIVVGRYAGSTACRTYRFKTYVTSNGNT